MKLVVGELGEVFVFDVVVVVVVVGVILEVGNWNEVFIFVVDVVPAFDVVLEAPALFVEVPFEAPPDIFVDPEVIEVPDTEFVVVPVVLVGKDEVPVFPEMPVVFPGIPVCPEFVPVLLTALVLFVPLPLAAAKVSVLLFGMLNNPCWLLKVINTKHPTKTANKSNNNQYPGKQQTVESTYF